MPEVVLIVKPTRVKSIRINHSIKESSHTLKFQAPKRLESDHQKLCHNFIREIILFSGLKILKESIKIIFYVRSPNKYLCIKFNVKETVCISFTGNNKTFIHFTWASDAIY